MMRVLWITNTLFPDVCNELGISAPVVGGWMYAGAMNLLESNSTIKLSVATIYDGSELKKMTLKSVEYYSLPNMGSKNVYNTKLEKYWVIVNNEFKPDIVHIHGSEYPHGLAYVHACGNKNVVVSIQGLVSAINKYYLAGISINELRKNITLRDYLKRDSIFDQQRNLQQRGLLEQEMIRSVNHVIGRTSWDKTHTWAINEKVNYHFCNETLRDQFYQYNWNLKTCEKYTIFLSQAHYPIKGLQQIIKALPIILRHYPDTKVYVAGNNVIPNRGFRMNGFGKYINSLIKEHNVKDHINFTGVLTEKEMCQRYIASHVFVCPSSIENSPNSIGEAEVLVVPCIGAFVGGMSDMIAHEVNGLIYRFEEIEMLAWLVCRIFSDDELALKLSENGKSTASIRHDKLQNAIRLNEIYTTICKD